MRTLLILLSIGAECFVVPHQVLATRGGRRQTSLAAVKPSKEKMKNPNQILASLALVYLSNQWCRSLLFSTVNFGSDDGYKFVNAALDLSEGDYALLGTLAFQILFSFASLAAGAAVDRIDAGAASVVACVVWSAATIFIGGGDSFQRVAALRAIQGLAMSVTAPAGYSLLAKTFDSSNLASANSAYAAAVSFGGALSSASVALDESIGWRNTFGLVGSLSLVIALVSGALLSKNDALFSDEKTDAVTTTASSATSLLSVFTKPATLLLLATAALRYCAGFTIAVFALPVFRSNFPDQAVQFGIAYAIVVAACGSASAFAGGRLADALAKKKGDLPVVWPFTRNPNAARTFVPFAGTLLAAPLWLAATHAPSLELAILGLSLEFFVAECWIGTSAALLANEVPPSSRGFAQGLFTALTIVGNLAPLAVGNAVSSGSTSLSVGTLVDISVVGAYILASLGFVAAAAFLSPPPPVQKKTA